MSNKKNNATTKAGLMFNVRRVKDEMNKHFEVQGKQKPLCKAANVGLGAVLETLTTLLVQNALPLSEENIANMVPLNAVHIQRSLTLRPDAMTHQGLSCLFPFLARYDNNTAYSTTIFTNDTLKQLVVRINDHVDMDPSAYNLMTYLLISVFFDMCNVGRQFINYKVGEKKDSDGKSSKGSFTDKTVQYVVENRFLDESLRKTLLDEMHRAVSSYNAEDEKDETEAEETEPEEKPKSKEKKKPAKEESEPEEKTKSKKKSAKKAPTDDEEDESEPDEKPKKKAPASDKASDKKKKSPPKEESEEDTPEDEEEEPPKKSTKKKGK